MEYQLLNLGLEQDEIEEIVSENESLRSLDIDEYIQFLKSLNCSDEQMKDIIISNPTFFDVNLTALKETFSFISQNLGITDIIDLIEKYPYILNKRAFEIEEYINEELKRGKSIDQIEEEFELDPSIIDE